MLIYRVADLFGVSEGIFQTTSQWLSLVPGRLGVYLRAAYYAWVGEQCSDFTSIGFLTTLSHADTTFGSSVYIGSHGNIGKCSIGDNCLLGSGVHILSGSHQHSFDDPDVPMKDQTSVYTKISIGADTWIGNQAVIMADVGSRCVVAAGAVVTKPVEDYSIVGGNPATVISKTNKAASVGADTDSE